MGLAQLVRDVAGAMSIGSSPITTKFTLLELSLSLCGFPCYDEVNLLDNSNELGNGDNPTHH